MNKRFFLPSLAMIAMTLTLLITSCGSDDGVMPLPQKSNLFYQINSISSDMTAFYEMEVTYLDLEGTEHTERIDGQSWAKKLNEGPVDARFRCVITARLKAEQPVVNRETYSFGYECKCSCYRPDLGVKDQTNTMDETIESGQLQEWLNAHQQITICNFNF